MSNERTSESVNATTLELASGNFCVHEEKVHSLKMNFSTGVSMYRAKVTSYW